MEITPPSSEPPQPARLVALSAKKIEELVECEDNIIKAATELQSNEKIGEPIAEQADLKNYDVTIIEANLEIISQNLSTMRAIVARKYADIDVNWNKFLTTYFTSKGGEITNPASTIPYKSYSNAPTQTKWIITNITFKDLQAKFITKDTEGKKVENKSIADAQKQYLIDMHNRQNNIVNKMDLVVFLDIDTDIRLPDSAGIKNGTVSDKPLNILKKDCPAILLNTGYDAAGIAIPGGLTELLGGNTDTTFRNNFAILYTPSFFGAGLKTGDGSSARNFKMADWSNGMITFSGGGKSRKHKSRSHSKSKRRHRNRK